MNEDSPPPSTPPVRSPRRIRRAPAVKKGRKPEPRVTPNRDVLLTLLQQRGISQTDVAREMGVSISTFSKSLSGARNYTSHEAVVWARMLNKSTDDALRLLGFRVSPIGVPLVGKILADHRVSSVLGDRKGERVRAPFAEATSVAYIYEPDNTIFIVDRDISQGKPLVPPDAHGRWCIVEAEGHDLPLFGRLEKASQRGFNTLTPYPLGKAEPRTVRVFNAAVVLTIDRP